MRVTLALPVMLLSSAAIGCYPEQIASLTQTVSVTTLVDSQAALKTAHTFALPDTIVHPARAQGADVIGHEHDSQILATIRSNLVVLGWREITNLAAERPDVVVLTFVLEQTIPESPTQTGGAAGASGLGGPWPLGRARSWGIPGTPRPSPINPETSPWAWST